MRGTIAELSTKISEIYNCCPVTRFILFKLTKQKYVSWATCSGSAYRSLASHLICIAINMFSSMHACMYVWLYACVPVCIACMYASVTKWPNFEMPACQKYYWHQIFPFFKKILVDEIVLVMMIDCNHYIGYSITFPMISYNFLCDKYYRLY